jgi:putative transposase
LGLPRSTLYYELAEPGREDLELMRLIDEQYLKTPFYGSRKMKRHLLSVGHCVNRKRVQRLMRRMGLEAIYPKPRTSQANPEHKVFPYLLRDLSIVRPNQVWAADITYVPMHRGFLYLVAVLDWYSRYVVAWRLSNTLETHFCVEALEAALELAIPEIFNTDQGAQFTALAFVDHLQQAGVQVSMDGRGRALDNVFVERLWRSVKYEEVYLRSYETVPELARGLRAYFEFYNYERYHQALDYRTPAEVHFAK